MSTDAAAKQNRIDHRICLDRENPIEFPITRCLEIRR